MTIGETYKPHLCPPLTASSPDHILLTGGASPTFQSTELFPPVPGCTPAQLPAYRRGHSTFLSNSGVVAACGGRDSSVYLSDCLIVNPVTKQWQSDTTVMGHLPGKRHYAADVTVAGVGTYLLGGSDGSYLSSSAFLPSGSATWQSGPDLPQSLFGACAFSYQQSVFITGGVSSIYLSDVREYSTETSQWQPASTWPGLQTARYHHGCGRLGKMAVIAGGEGGGGQLSSTELIDLETKVPTRGGNLKSARWATIVRAVKGGKTGLYVIGGDLVEEWREGTGDWVEVARLQERRHSYVMGAVAVPAGLLC